MKSKFLSALLCFALVLSLFQPFVISYASTPEEAVSYELPNNSRQLNVVGNKVFFEGTQDEIRLTGLNISALEVNSNGDSGQVYSALRAACEDWNSNIIRLPISVYRWYGYASDQKITAEQEAAGIKTYDSYRKIVRNMINACAVRGKYLILDVHHSNPGRNDEIKLDGIRNTILADKMSGMRFAPDMGVLDFWVDMSKEFGNNPTVLFGLYNEPHDVSWETWRNGGPVEEELIDVENSTPEKIVKKKETYQAAGHQQIIEAIRDAGAKNIVVAGGLDWGYDLRGVAGKAYKGKLKLEQYEEGETPELDPKSYALVDQGSNDNAGLSGYGIIYDSHIYPWKGKTKNWDEEVGCVRLFAPILAGETGWDRLDITIIKPEVNNQPDMDYIYWVPELLDWYDNEVSSTGINYGNKVNFTGWCFHPSSSPRLLKDWNFNPTDFWGVYLKERMLSYDTKIPNYETPKFINTFAPEDKFAWYSSNSVTLDDGTKKSLMTASVIPDKKSLKISYSATENNVKPTLNIRPNPSWIFNGIQSIKFDYLTDSNSAGDKVVFGIEELDGDLWTAEFELSETEKTFNINIDQLKLANDVGDRVFNQSIKTFYFAPVTPSGGSFEISNFEVSQTSNNDLLEFMPVGNYRLNSSESKELSIKFPAEISTKEYTTMRFYVRNNSPKGFKPNLVLSVGESGEAYTNLDFASDPLLVSEGWHLVQLATPQTMGNFSDIKIKTVGSEDVDVELKDFVFTNLSHPTANTATKYYRHLFDMDNSDFANAVVYEGKFADKGDSFKYEIVNGDDVNNSRFYKFDYNYTEETDGGTCSLILPKGIELRNARYISFKMKGDGTNQTVGIHIRDDRPKFVNKKVDINLTDDKWRTYTFKLSDFAADITKTDLTTQLAFYAKAVAPSTTASGSFMVDDIVISSAEVEISGLSANINGKDISKNGLENGKAVLSVNLANNTGSDKSVFLVSAVYEKGENQKLCGINLSSVTVPAESGNNSFTFESPSISDAKVEYIRFWAFDENMNKLDEQIIY